MRDVPQDLRQRLREFDQEHVLAWWDQLTVRERADLEGQLRGLDHDELRRLFARRDEKGSLPAAERVTPLPRPQHDAAQQRDDQRRARDALRAGSVAYLVVAGGQGTRLGFDLPKGIFPVGPVTSRPLFQYLAEKVLALRRRYGAALPLLVMTSPATDAPTRLYFARQRCFGLPPEDVRFFCQGTMPALDLATGRLLLEAPGRLSQSPNGHGGTLTGLAESGLLDEMGRRGVQTIYYFQVDNPLVDLGDLGFIGQHLSQRAEVSSKVLPKVGPREKVGNVVLIDGRCSIIEYSDLPEEWARQTDSEGRPRLWAANPAIHLFDCDFLRRMTREAGRIPWHVARKKVTALDATGTLAVPTQENALKFERFIFDVLPQAERWTVRAIRREEEFAPVKNAEGADSPRTARQAICNLVGAWCRHAGLEVPTDPQGDVTVPLEISPLFALDADEFAARVRGPARIDGPMIWE